MVNTVVEPTIAAEPVVAAAVPARTVWSLALVAAVPPVYGAPSTIAVSLVTVLTLYCVFVGSLPNVR